MARSKRKKKLSYVPKQRPAAFSQRTDAPLGQPLAAGRPHVTEHMMFKVQPTFTADMPASAPLGSHGLYQLTYVLAVPGRTTVHDAVNFKQLVDAGDSLLEVGPSVHTLQLELSGTDGDKLSLAVGVNAQRRLSYITFKVVADNFENATAFGYDIISPMLSRWSYLHDVGLTTSAVEVVEIATQTHQWTLRIVGAVKAFADRAGASSPDHRLLLAAYREGISSTDPLWQALSLYRAAEGALSMRNTRIAAILRAGGSATQPVDRLPDDVESLGPANDYGLRDSMRPFTGKKFSDVLRNNIRPTIRNAAAHMDIDSTVLIQDRWDDIQKVERILPALRWIARQIVESELQAKG